MSKNDEQLVGLIKDVVSGSKDKEAFCNEFYKEVYALVYPVFEDNSKKVTSRAFIYLCDNLNKIDVNKNIHRQIATLVSTFMFNLIDKNTIKNNADGLEYEYSKVKEDTELYNVIRDNVKMFRNPSDYDNVSESIKSLSRVQTILLELYGYEMHSVEEIEELLDMDSAFICEFLAKTRAQILGIPISTTEEFGYEEDTEPDVSEYESDESEDEDTTDDSDEETEEDPDDEKSYFEDDDSDYDDDSDEHPFRKKTKAERNAAMRRADASNPVVGKLAGLVGKLFPSLSQAARRIVVYVTGGVILLAIVVSIFLSALLSNTSKSAAKKNNNTNNTKVTTAETASSSEKTTKAKNTQKNDETTAADGNAAEETTKAEEKTEEKTTKQATKAAVKEADDETVEDSDGGSDNGDGEETSEKETEPSTKETEATTKEKESTTEAITKETEPTTEATTKETEAATKAPDADATGAAAADNK